MPVELPMDEETVAKATRPLQQAAMKQPHAEPATSKTSVADVTTGDNKLPAPSSTAPAALTTQPVEPTSATSGVEQGSSVIQKPARRGNKQGASKRRAGPRKNAEVTGPDSQNNSASGDQGASSSTKRKRK